MNDKKNRIPIPGRYVGTGSSEDPLIFEVTEGGRLMLMSSRLTHPGFIPQDMTAFYEDFRARDTPPWELSPSYGPETLPAGLWVIDGDDTVYEILEGGLINGYYPVDEDDEDGEPLSNYGLGVRILSGRLLFPATDEDRLKAGAPVSVETASDLEAKVSDLSQRLEQAQVDNEALNQRLQDFRDSKLSLRHAFEELHGRWIAEMKARRDVEEDLDEAKADLKCRRTGKDAVGTWYDVEGEDYWRDYWRERSIAAERERNALRGLRDAIRAASEAEIAEAL